MRIKINNAWYEIDEGAVITENYNEALDTATVRISNLTTSLDIEPLDDVEIESDLGTRYFCVDTYTEMMTSVNPEIYSYEISLISQTKQLENLILPNLTITRNIDNPRTVYSYIKQYLDEYSEKIRYEIPEEDERNITLTGNLFESTGKTKVIEGILYDEYKTNINFNHRNGFEVLTDTTSALYAADVYNRETGNYGDYSIITIVLYLRTGTVIQDSREYVNVKFEKYLEQTNKFILDYSIYEKFKDMECPEFQWSNPTLREVFNELFMLKDCIPVVRNNIIYYLDLTETQQISSEKQSTINYIQKSQSISDYVSELYIDMRNIIGKQNNIVQRCRNMHFISTDYIMTTNNFFLQTSMPIVSIDKLVVNARINITYRLKYFNRSIYEEVYLDKSSAGLASKDITFMVRDYEEWITLPVRKYSSGTINPQYANDCLYFNKYGNKIDNFRNNVRNIPLFDGETYLWQKIYEHVISNAEEQDVSQSLINKLRNEAIEESGVSEEDIIGYELFFDEISHNWYDLLFDVDYRTTQNAVSRISKENAPRNNKVVADNQSSVYVDSEKQGFLEYQKANRLGNKQLHINARTFDFDNVLKIGEKFNDSIIYQCQYSIYREHIEINAIATKDYVLRDYFTGVKAKPRLWKTKDSNEATTKELIDKYYCEFSSTQFDDILANIDLDIQILLNGRINDVKYAAVKTYCDNDIVYPESERGQYYLLDLSKRVIGNSLVFNFGFSDNLSVENYFSISKSVIDEDGFIDLRAINKGGIPLDFYRYADTYGNFNKIKYLLTTEVQDGTDSIKDIIWASARLPATDDINLSEIVLSNTLENVKDSGEIVRVNLQLEFCSDTRNIVFTDNLVRSCNIDTSTCKIYYTNRETPLVKNALLNLGKVTPENCQSLGFFTDNSTLTISKQSKSCKFVINSNLFRWGYFIITDEEGNILLASKYKTFYLNLLKDRKK